MPEQIQHVYPHIIAAIMSRPWAIHEATMSTILGVMEMRADGMRLSAGEVQERLTAAKMQNGPRAGGKREKQVAVIPLYGVITPRASGLASSGANSVEAFREDFRAALADDDVDAIVLDVDSPGGVVDGLPEMWQEVFDARGQKPMTAVANTQMASGALWLSSAVDRIVASPSATVGSIGVIGVHKDKSAQYAKDGIKHTIIKTSKFKGEGHDSEPLSEDAQAYMLQEAMEYDGMFHDALATSYGVDAAKIREAWGQGRMLTAKRALEVGMVHDIMTLEQAVQSAPGVQMRGTAPSISLGAYLPEPMLRVSMDGGSTWTPLQQSGDAWEVTLDDSVDVTLHDSPSGLAVHIPGVLSSTEAADAPATVLPFAERLRLATAELEAVVSIARERATRRLDDGRPLSSETREHLGRLKVALEELATVNPEAPKAAQVAGTDTLDLMLQMYQEGSFR